MTIKEVTEINTTTKRVYVASDGSEFGIEKKCRDHEEHIALKRKIGHIPFKEFYYDGYYNWYYLTSEQELNSILRYTCHSIHEDKDYSFPDWFSFQTLESLASLCGDKEIYITLNEIKRKSKEIEIFLTGGKHV